MRTRRWLLAALLALAGGGFAASERGVVLVPDGEGRKVALYRGSHALLIGVSDYTNGWPDLESVPGELASVRRLLHDQGFKVVEVPNPNADRLRKAFQDFINDHGRASDNRLLFFFSGHGHTLEKGYKREMGYIVPADAPLPERDRNGFLRTAVSMNQVLTWAREIDAKHALFLFDSCFSGTVFKARNLPERPPHIGRLTAEPVREFITAGSAGETVPAESVFTPAFVNALRHGLGDLDQDGFVTGMELGLHLQAKVPRHTDQTPQYGKIRDYPLSLGDFVFALERRPAPPPPPAVRFLGNIQVNVNVPARVYLGDEGPAPAQPGQPLNRTGVPAGRTEVRVEAEGYQSQTRIAQVRRGQWTQLVFELAPKAPPGIAAARPSPPTDPKAEEAALNLTQGQRRRLQQALNERGFAAGPADGVLGARSRRALAAYQRRRGEAPTGYLTAGQWAKLRQQTPPAPSRREDWEPEMVAIKGGCFQMGSRASEEGRDDDERQHRVCVDDFKIAKYEATLKAFRRFVDSTGYRTDAEKIVGGKTGCYAYDQEDSEKSWNWRDWASWRKPNKHQKNRDDHPVACVSWNDAQAYIEWLSGETGQRYRLPTEAEWEYAARGGSSSARYWGDDPDEACRYANVADRTKLPPGDVSWSTKHECEDGYPYASPVGRFRANEYSLFDMLGNVWEWTCSAYDEGYGGGERRCVGQDPVGAVALRGGSWYGRPGNVRSAGRGGNTPDNRGSDVGFRLVQD